MSDILQTRQWYCSPQLEYELGTVSFGSATQRVFAPSSNPWILSDCDLVDRCSACSWSTLVLTSGRFGDPLPNPDAQCESVTNTNAVGGRRQCTETTEGCAGQRPVLWLLRAQHGASHAHVELHSAGGSCA
eukprot:758573-Hanusia_phi.AAC.10